MLYKYQFYPVVPDVWVELNITVSYNIDQNSIWSAGNSTNEAVDELSYQHLTGWHISNNKHMTGTAELGLTC